tara:strand:- start:23 stop:457 length:435 start_codon:yes stop_codon:yes gene_type:complete
MKISDVAYIAGLFDGEGCVSYKQYNRQRKHNKKPYPTWQIRVEIAMTDKAVIEWLHETLGFGWSAEKKYNTKPKYKRQWRWCCGYRDALIFAKLLWPFAQVKLHKLEQIIDHYEPRIQNLDDNVVDLETERKSRVATNPWNNLL